MLSQAHTDELYAIKFEVFDFDTFGANDFMGEAIVKREEIEKKSVIDSSTTEGSDQKMCSMELQLKEKPGKNDDVSGYIVMSFKFTDPDVKIEKPQKAESKVIKKTPVVDRNGTGAGADDEDFEHIHQSEADEDGALMTLFSQAMTKVTLKREKSHF